MNDSIKPHTHKTPDGMEYTHTHNQEQENTHSHAHSHNQEHKHNHQNTKAVLDRLSRASGHLESVKRMIAEGRDCSEVLIQLSAVIAALNNTGKVILKDHLENCIVDAVESGDNKAIDNLNKAIDSFMK
jgi:DNA-binding FrmR family transcriptional regulator